MIVRVRGQAVILDSDLAGLYGVPTKRLNEQAKRNKDRFPEDFVFQLSSEDTRRLRSQNATASKRNIRHLPYAFTERGAPGLSQPLFIESNVKGLVLPHSFVLLLVHQDLALFVVFIRPEQEHLAWSSCLPA